MNRAGYISTNEGELRNLTRVSHRLLAAACSLVCLSSSSSCSPPTTAPILTTPLHLCSHRAMIRQTIEHSKQGEGAQVKARTFERRRPLPRRPGRKPECATAGVVKVPATLQARPRGGGAAIFFFPDVPASSSKQERSRSRGPWSVIYPRCVCYWPNRRPVGPALET